MKNFKQKPQPEVKVAGLGADPVTKYMAVDLITFRPDTEIKEAIETLLSKRISGAPVLNENKEVVGLIDDKDCLSVLIDSVYHNQPLSKNTVGHYMSNVMKTININSDIVDVANIFMSTKFKRLVVVDDEGKLKGQVSRRDILRAIKEMNSSTWYSGK